MAILGDILEELGVVALVYQDDSSFQMLGNQSSWFSCLITELESSIDNDLSTITKEALCLTFPFIDNFLIDAETTWNELDHKSIRSGLWTETTTSGDEYQLEACACWLQGQSVLLVENHSASFVQHHAVYQKARDIALLNEKLISELNQRQRELQTEIEQRILQGTSISGVAESIKGHTSAVMICQPDGNVEVMNNALIDIYQTDKKSDLKRVSLLDQWLKEAEEQYPELKRVIENGSYWEGEFESKSTDGNIHWIRLAIGPIKESTGSISHYVCIANDISEYRQTNTAVGGGFDITTRLPNRRHFWQHINNLAEKPLPADMGIGLLYIDLDYFKRVNDDLGHQAGDFLLSAIASRISRGVKHSDFVAHLGGDEFVVVARLIKNNDQLMSVAKRLLETIHDPLSVDDQPISMSASIGVSFSYETMFDSKLLVRQADLAMYAAKELGKGQALFYEGDMDYNIPNKLQREMELLEAVEKQEFVLYLQPQISVNSTQKLKTEALIRWQHPVKGLLQPNDFIALAEESGLIIPLGEWVLKSACLMGAELVRQGKNVSIAVNISAKQLKHKDFYTSVINSLKESNYPADLLELEITESCVLDDLDGVILLIQKIRKLGVTISLDDFGTGYSSLNYLRQLPVDFLKIDQSFVQALTIDKQTQAIITFVINLAHELDISVIAEGVETTEQLNFLLKRNVNFIQGFLFDRPMPINELIGRLPKIESINNKDNID
jgi:diguanylate cyclase (GGDEF)-like protein/PAS domain S-box-containing protein